MPYIFVVMIIYQQENHKNQNKYLFCFRDKKTGYEGLGVGGLGWWQQEGEKLCESVP